MSASAPTSATASMASSNPSQNEEMMKLIAAFLAAQSKPTERASESPPSLYRKWDAAYITPTFTIRKFEEHEKLRGHSNFKSRTKMINLELAALNLFPFIQSEASIEMNLSMRRRTMLDARALQLIRASVDRSIVKHLNKLYCAYSAHKMLEETFKKVRRKAKLVAVACVDSEKYSDKDKSAPTPSSGVISWMFALAASGEWDIEQIDVETAYLYRKIDRIKYVSVPEGISIDRNKFVCLLSKALYGLPTAPKCWYLEISSFIIECGFQQIEREQCVYVKTEFDFDCSYYNLRR